MRKYLFISVLVFLHLSIPDKILSQDPSFLILEQYRGEKIPETLLNEISVDFNNTTFQVALETISTQGSVQLSFNNSNLPLNSRITARVENVSVLEALLMILKKTDTVLKLTAGGSLVIIPKDQIEQTSSIKSKIQGIVKDAGTGTPLPGANIYLVGTAIGSASDLKGEYQILSVPPGRYTLRATFIGYKQKDIEIQILPGETRIIDILMDYDVVEGETVTITAQAEGQIAAINQQLRSNTITNVVSAERVMEFPDANAAESVGRLPGISIRRSGGEGNKIVIRGLSPQYNVITIGGERIPATDLDDRSVDLNMISPEILAGIEVTKALTPDKDADTFGGTVDFKLTEAPAGGFQSNFRLRWGYNDYRKDFGNYKGSFSLSDRMWNKKLGLLITGNLERAQRGSDRFDADYIEAREKREGEEYAPITITDLRLRYVNEIRKRLGFNVLVDYKLNNGKIGLSNFFNRLDRSEITNENRYDAERNRHRYAVRDNQQQIDIMSNSFTGEHTLQFGVIDWRMSRTASVTRIPLSNYFDCEELSAYDFTEAPQFIGPHELVAIAVNDLNRTTLFQGTSQSEKSFERDLSAQVNLKIPFAPIRNISGFIKLGAKYRDKSKERSSNSYFSYLHDVYVAKYHTRAGDPNFEFVLHPATGDPGILNYIDPDFDPGNFLNGEYDFPVALDIDELNYLRSIFAMDSTYLYNASGGMNDFETVEKVISGYIMAEINFGRYIMFLPGVRYEYNHADMTGRVGTVREIGMWEDTWEQPAIGDTAATNFYGRWFPMVHFRVRPSGWFDIRLAFTRSVVYPRLNWMLPKKVISSREMEVTMGNPRLKPQMASNYDAFLSLYGNKIGLFTLGLFYKEIEDLIFNREGHVILDAAKENLDRIVQGYTLDRPENNLYLTRVHGFEIEWQTNFHWLRRPFNGLVLNINYTHIWSKTNYPRSLVAQERIPVFPYVRTTVIDTFRTGDMLDQADDIANVSLGYDLGPFSARLSMLFQGQTLSNIGERKEQDLFTVDLLRWDFTIKCDLTRNLELFYSLNNITNEPDRTFRFDSSYPTSNEYYGWTSDIGIGYRF